MLEHRLEDLLERVTIPTLPEVVRRINTMLADSSIGLHEIGEVVAQDAPITAKVLRIANSAYYGLTEPVVSAEQAANVIGGKALRNIVLQASVISSYEHLSSVRHFDLKAVWTHSILCAQVAQVLAERFSGDLGAQPEEFYTCGLLHDLGKVVLLDSLGQDYVDVFLDARDKGRALHASERELMGFDHNEVGVRVAARWEFPEAVREAIQYHHGPEEEVFTRPNVAVVGIADQLSYRVQLGDLEPVRERLTFMAQAILQIDREAFDPVIDFAAETLPLIEL